MDVVCTSTLCPVKSSTTRTLCGVAAQKYALQFSFLKKIELQKVRGGFRKIGRLRGLFGKFGVDGVLVDY